MTVSDIGWCSQCHGNVLDHPAIVCGWCNAAAGTLAKRELELAVNAPPAEVIRATSDYIDECMTRIRSAQTLRTGAARLALAGDVAAIATAADVRVRSIEKWAKLTEAACANGHTRSEHGKWDHERRRWSCLECERLKAPRKPKVVPRGRTRVRDAWRAHENRMRQREILAAAGQLPDHLKPPLEPPVKLRRDATSEQSPD